MTFYEDREENGVLLRWCPGCDKWKPRQRAFRGRRICRTCEASKASREDGRKELYRGAKRTYTATPRETSPFDGNCVDVAGLDRFLRAKRVAGQHQVIGS